MPSCEASTSRGNDLNRLALGPSGSQSVNQSTSQPASQSARALPLISPSPIRQQPTSSTSGPSPHPRASSITRQTPLRPSHRAPPSLSLQASLHLPTAESQADPAIRGRPRRSRGAHSKIITHRPYAGLVLPSVRAPDGESSGPRVRGGVGGA